MSTPKGNRTIDEVIGKWREFSKLDPDSFDEIEFLHELEQEFGVETVTKSTRILAEEYDAPNPPPGGSDPLWDKELDG